MTLTRQQIAERLRSVGIQKKDVLLVHSALRSLGPVEGGAAAVLAALLDVLGPDGTLMMPGFQRGSEYVFASQGICFDVRNTPSGCGGLTEFFRRYPGAKRSLSPTHSMTVLGPQSDRLIQGHERCRVTAGWGSPFERLIEADGRILMLGAPRNSLTMMHFLENTGGAPTLCAQQFKTSVIDVDGRVIETPIYPHMPALRRDYSRAVDLLAKAGGVSCCTIGNARCELYDAKLLRRVAYSALEENPCAFIDVFTPEAVEFNEP